MVARFSRAHHEFYGFSLEGEPVEFVNLRVSVVVYNEEAFRHWLKKTSISALDI